MMIGGLMSGNWVTGEPDDWYNEPQPTPSIGWVRGQTVQMVEAVCCPNCGSLIVTRKKTAGTVDYWYCGDCSHRWKLAAVTQISSVKVCGN